MPDSSPPTDVRQAPSDELTVEFYETEEGVVLYEAENPLAWIQSRQTLTVDEMV